MSKSNNLHDFLLTIANAIRIKTGKTGKINPQNFDSEILGIETGINPSGTKYITSTSKEDVTSYSHAVVYDDNLIPSNIKLGVNILGVVGTYEAQPDEPVEPDTPIQKYFTVDGVQYPFTYMTLWGTWVTTNGIYDIANGYISKDNGKSRLIDSQGDEAEYDEYILPDEVYTSTAFEDDVYIPFLWNGQNQVVREGTKWGVWGVEHGYSIDGNNLYRGDDNGNPEYYLCDLYGNKVDIRLDIKQGNYVDVLMPDFSFYIDDTRYDCRYGMTWGDWVNSEFNTPGYAILGDYFGYISSDWDNINETGKIVADSGKVPVEYIHEISVGEYYRTVSVL